jgi:predicted lysophospholipase L1 biosynthesis ABC-type transport system permease subunit
VIVNEGMARQHWGAPGQSPLGRKLRVVFNGQGEWKTIVGVVANASTRGLTAQASDPMIYMAGTGFFRPTLIVRTSGATASLQALRDITSEIDPSLSPPRLTNIEDAMNKSILRPRFTMLLLLIFTIVAVGLAAIGLYGVLAYTVAQRTREIGIRMALGASRRVIARAVLSQGLALAAIGAVIGLLATRGTVKLISSVLYGVQPTDLVSFTSGGVLLVVIAALACLVPIRRALAVDPMIAMRAD